ncbi:MAG: LapA family protein [Chitinispirillia bacterium]|nr:LapA family protein [Chitinispirillia bacterium]
MKILKWGSVVVITFAAACVVIFTFIQPEFSGTNAPLKFFKYTTAPFPIYIFVAAAFGIGLCIGLAATAYYYVVGLTGIRGKKKEIKKLTESISSIESELDKYRTTAEKNNNKKGGSSGENSGDKRGPSK